jgi:hypothetical protein
MALDRYQSSQAGCLPSGWAESKSMAAWSLAEWALRPRTRREAFWIERSIPGKLELKSTISIV